MRDLEARTLAWVGLEPEPPEPVVEYIGARCTCVACVIRREEDEEEDRARALALMDDVEIPDGDAELYSDSCDCLEDDCCHVERP
jgi:hypothetical protein